MPRTRLTPNQRRDHLMDVGAKVFAVQAYEDISMDGIAGEAGVSRALLYHYFPNKRDFFSAIWARAHDGLLESAVFDDTRPLIEQARDALTAHYVFYEQNAALVFIANRSEISSDPIVRDPVMADLNIIRHRLLDASGATGHTRAIASAGLAGWIALVREVGIEWLQYRQISRVEAIDICMATLVTAVGPGIDLDRTPG
ncbi:TetR/AcrR family transcriptional regulator [Antrihabitans cavernicola]|uniref:TetR/AcrR family transcriptional regulator n=1 Tax=Antrihabitans cavernicola TaxID=2495913 RepID=A0A5A7S1R9_9NOCA|nr:TetR/AcrR family transcriptional regulator [Spelaeibacter cavernicola]KAA0017381.1 TetR/AcrR family transcriptional regulator [Spelaeibacter cavernicola]